MKITTAHRLYMRQVESRKKAIKKMRLDGFTWKQIGLAFGITHQRAQQIGAKKNAPR
jgi:DNA-binding transcriptional MerR regulator